MFAIGIKNNHEDPQAEHFKIYAECIAGFANDAQKTTICSRDGGADCNSNPCNSFWINTQTVYHVPKGESVVEGVFIKIPKKDSIGEAIIKGQYVFQVHVKAFLDPQANTPANPAELDIPKKFYVNVNK